MTTSTALSTLKYFLLRGGDKIFILLERYWDSSHEAQGKYHPWPSVKEGVTLKQGEDGEGAKRQNQVGGLMKCHAPIISWVSLLPASHCVSFCQYHTWDPYFLSKAYELYIELQKPYKILSQRPMLISIINSLIAPKVWWFSVLWWGPTKRLCNGIETACEAVSPLAQLHHWPHHQRHHYHRYQSSSSSPVSTKSQESSVCNCHFLPVLSQVAPKICTSNCHKIKGCHIEKKEYTEKTKDLSTRRESSANFKDLPSFMMVR